MPVITKRRIGEAKKKYPSSAKALDAWHWIMSKNKFSNFSDLKKTFNSVDKVDHLVVFNIGGNKLRLIASIHFNRQKVFIRYILTHKEYDLGNWKKRHEKKAKSFIRYCH